MDIDQVDFWYHRDTIGCQFVVLCIMQVPALTVLTLIARTRLMSAPESIQNLAAPRRLVGLVTMIGWPLAIALPIAIAK
ncbi:MAG: hypothetical protein JWM95_4283 [Gemmatimonadetes bacterium]|nr:hypothetical protein [Gemmatimonadota bacterium]